MKPENKQLHIVNTLTEAQTGQLHSLYQGEWWSVGRSLADVRMMLQHSDFIFGVAAPDSQQLLAFARVLTDRVFKAILYDVIVVRGHRGSGIGSFLMSHLLTDTVLSQVRHFDLHCLPEREGFYRPHGFIAGPAKLQLMRRANELQSTGNS